MKLKKKFYLFTATTIILSSMIACQPEPELIKFETPSLSIIDEDDDVLTINFSFNDPNKASNFNESNMIMLLEEGAKEETDCQIDLNFEPEDNMGQIIASKCSGEGSVYFSYSEGTSTSISESIFVDLVVDNNTYSIETIHGELDVIEGSPYLLVTTKENILLINSDTGKRKAILSVGDIVKNEEKYPGVEFLIEKFDYVKAKAITSTSDPTKALIQVVFLQEFGAGFSGVYRFFKITIDKITGQVSEVLLDKKDTIQTNQIADIASFQRETTGELRYSEIRTLAMPGDGIALNFLGGVLTFSFLRNEIQTALGLKNSFHGGLRIFKDKSKNAYLTINRKYPSPTDYIQIFKISDAPRVITESDRSVENLSTINLEGEYRHLLGVSNDGSKLYYAGDNSNSIKIATLSGTTLEMGIDEIEIVSVDSRIENANYGSNWALSDDGRFAYTIDDQLKAIVKIDLDTYEVKLIAK